MASENIVDRFVRYVRIDTQSDEDSTNSPSSAKQLDLARLLVEELRGLGLSEIVLSEHGVVTATLPGNLPAEQAAKVPVVGLLAHLDTSPAVSGANVKPQIVVYDGGDVALPGDPGAVIRAAECPELAKYKGKKIITSDGTTLLGADDKAGIAAVMHALAVLQSDPSIKHGKLRIGFTPDEEVGRGTEHLDPKAFGADLAYTIDGGDAGEVENETFCADGATVVIQGHNQHPGYAKNIMVNAVRIAADFIARMPRHRAPETSEKRECYVHPDSISGSVEQTTIKLIVRAFTVEELLTLERTLDEIKQEVQLLHPKAKIEIKIVEQYRNMRYKLEQKASVVEHAMEAVRRVGLTPVLASIRGGTDGARLTEQGLPTPNLFAGGINFHSKKEWIAVEALEAASRTVIEICKLWVERPLLT